MKVADIKSKLVGPDIIFSADFFISSPIGLRRRDKILNVITGKGRLFPYHIWFKIPKRYCRRANPEDSFFIIAYMFAAKLDEPLHFDGQVSEKLYSNIRKAGVLLKLKNPEIEIVAKGLVKRKNKNNGVAQFFSLGIDSFYTLLAGPMSNSQPRKKFIVFVEGFDLTGRSKDLVDRVSKNINLVTKETRTIPVWIKTNLRSISYRIIDWELFHGAVLAASGLLLSNEVKTIYINATDSYHSDILWGTNKELDLLWSTESMSFLSSGDGLTRIQKVEEIKKTRYLDLFLENLRVCYQKYSQRDALYNCSHCPKCIFSQYILLGSGIKEPFPTFFGSTLDNLNPRHSVTTPYNYPSWREIYRRLKTKAGYREHASKLKKILQAKGVLT